MRPSLAPARYARDDGESHHTGPTGLNCRRRLEHVMETVLAFITGCLLAGVVTWVLASRARRAGERMLSAEKSEALAQVGSARESLARASAEIEALRSGQEK